MNQNIGKGFALVEGLKRSVNEGASFTFTIDADFQHPPELIPNFLGLADNFDLIIGNRLNDVSKMPIQRRASNYLTSKLLSIKTGVKILDSQSGYRLFRTSCIMNILSSRNGFEAESEMIVNAAKNNFKIGFVSIPTIYGDTDSKMRPMEAIWGFIKVIFSK